ncbi:MAG TPA: branched-chain amino acid ABC transporter permease [Chloroflexi bacterium]|nr:branched-chain amino acid ABC transporter permease [Chloroflexota bacterium]
MGGTVDTVIQSLLNGALMGCVYALITLGLSLIFGVMNVVNFAHGDFVMLAMYFTFFIGSMWGVDAVFTPAVTFPLLFLVGVVAYYLIIDGTLRQKYVTQIAVTVGLMTFLRALTQLMWKAQPRALPYSLIQGSIHIAGYNIMLSRLISAGVSILAIGGVSLFLSRTWPGRAIRAASDDLDAASLMGVNYRWTYALAFGLGSALTAIAGGLLMTFQQVDPTMGVRFGLLSWCVLALAGLGSIPGLLISGVIVGAAEALSMSLWDPRARSLIVYLIFILVLWVRPRGLFGRK